MVASLHPEVPLFEICAKFCKAASEMKWPCKVICLVKITREQGTAKKTPHKWQCASAHKGSLRVDGYFFVHKLLHSTLEYITLELLGIRTHGVTYEKMAATNYLPR